MGARHRPDRAGCRSPLIAAGVGWTAGAAIERNKDYWALVTRAELALIEDRKDDALDDYSEAAAIAVDNRDWFALDSSSQQLDFLGELKFRSRDRRGSRRRSSTAPSSSCAHCSAAVRNNGPSPLTSSSLAGT